MDGQDQGTEPDPASVGLSAFVSRGRGGAPYGLPLPLPGVHGLELPPRSYDSRMDQAESAQTISPGVRAGRSSILRQWRRLTRHAANRRTLIGCSGGADSSALAVVLASARCDVVVAHVVHDMRPRSEALADRDAVRSLAGSLGVEFVEMDISGSCARGNRERAARVARYLALTDCARGAACGFIATGHHADDQAETVLMALLRGAGPAGLRGIAPSRSLDDALTLIRPMLRVTRADAQAICREAGVSWRDDATNLDTTRLRAAIRHTVLPTLASLRPQAVAKLAESADVAREVANLIETHAQRVWREGTDLPAGGRAWSRPALAAVDPVVIGEFLRLAVCRLAEHRRLDRLSRSVRTSVVRVIRSGPSHQAIVVAGGVRIEIEPRRIIISRKE